MLLIKKCNLYAPEAKGLTDVLVGGGKFECFASDIQLPFKTYTIEANGWYMVPGFVDTHTHFAGAGGEGGQLTRTSPLEHTIFVKSGVTTVIGCLGTDGFTRHLQDVLQTCKALNRGNLSAYFLTGSYQIPPPSILENSELDICCFEECLGIGELALYDHRSSFPEVGAVRRIIAGAHVAGLLAGKTGKVVFHIGSIPGAFTFLEKCLEDTEISDTQVLPIHCNRSAQVLAEAAKYAAHGEIDLTAGGSGDKDFVPASQAIAYLHKKGIPENRISVSSDANGSFPRFDRKGNFLGMEVGNPASLLDEFKILHKNYRFPLEKALKYFTENPAKFFGLKNKGRIEIGTDADFLLLSQDLELKGFCSQGAFLYF